MSAPSLCVACGRPLRPGARFCPACGAAVGAGVVVVEGAQSPLSSVAPVRGRARGSAALPVSFDGVRPAGVGARLLAYVVDAVVVGLGAGAVALVSGRVALGALVAVELAVGLVVWEARTGRTFGNALVGLRTARAEAPYALGLARAVPRGLVLAAGHVVALGQWLVVASSGFGGGGLHQGWHDRVARAVVVDVRGPREQVAAAPASAREPVRSAAARPASAGQGAARPEAPHSYLVTLDTGHTVTVSGPGLVGRAPRVAAGERCDHLIAIDDPERSLSRTHARFGVDRTGFWVADAASGNGTVVVPPGGQAVAVAPDARVPVPSGSTVRIGDRSFTVHAVRA